MEIYKDAFEWRFEFPEVLDEKGDFSGFDVVIGNPPYGAKFSYEEKCKCVLEETMVIALERKILPMIYGKGKYISSDEALGWALMRVCTTLCSGWFREFAVNNYFDIWKYRDQKYVETFLTKVDKGEIKRIEETVLE